MMDKFIAYSIAGLIIAVSLVLMVALGTGGIWVIVWALSKIIEFFTGAPVGVSFL